MARMVLREDEVRVISVTPVAHGVVRPLVCTVAAIATVVYASDHLALVREFRPWIMLVLAGPCALVLATRTWRWRSHKVHVTTQRVVVEGGVARHQRTSYELGDIVATHVDQRLHERLSRRGWLLIDTVAGTVPLGRVRHPEALARLIDRERTTRPRDAPLDTIFAFPEPTPTNYRAERGRRARHHG